MSKVLVVPINQSIDKVLTEINRSSGGTSKNSNIQHATTSQTDNKHNLLKARSTSMVEEAQSILNPIIS
jgi:hypothetical protein